MVISKKPTSMLIFHYLKKLNFVKLKRKKKKYIFIIKKNIS